MKDANQCLDCGSDLMTISGGTEDEADVCCKRNMLGTVGNRLYWKGKLDQYYKVNKMSFYVSKVTRA